MVSQLQSFLQSPQRLIDTLTDAVDGPVEIQEIVDKAKSWSSTSINEIQSVLHLIVKRIVVGERQVEIQLSKRSLREMAIGFQMASTPSASMPCAEDLVSIEIQAKLQRCGGEVRLILPPDGTP